jgi:NADPH-dependent 2,4-dienoyl-CoA reductase/sulfur reductase-like enzyme
MIPATTLLLHQGVVPQVNLAMASGVAHVWSEARLAFEPALAPDGETTVPGLFIAGDSAGIGGAQAAQARGLLGGLAILDRISPATRASRQTQRSRAEASLARSLRGRAFLDALYRPAPQFRMPADDVIICRCEDVTAGDLRTSAAAMGTTDINRLKALTRVGMGRCQGRMCGVAACEILAQSSGQPLQAVGRLRGQAPVKPIPFAMTCTTSPTKPEAAR